jgi:acetyl esterase/lipase
MLDRGERGVVVLIHGGFWKAERDRSLMDPLAADLADRGWTTWNLEYRRLGNGGGFPATLEDASAGIDHLAELDVDTTRVIAVGHSAGGHLAAWSATREDPRVPVTDVVAQAGVLDPRLARELGLSDAPVHAFLDSLDDAAMAAFSPRERLPLQARRTLLTHGEADDTVPVRMSREFAAASGAELHIDPEAGHMEHIDPAHPLWQTVVAWL